MLDLDTLDGEYWRWQRHMDLRNVQSAEIVYAHFMATLLDAFPALIAELRASRKALQRIVDERERNPQAAPGMCDECVRPIAEHLPWCAAAIAREALSINVVRSSEEPT